MDENPYEAERPSWLADIWAVTRERERLNDESEQRYIAWCALIAKAVEGGHRVTDIAKAANVTPKRIYQIMSLLEEGAK